LVFLTGREDIELIVKKLNKKKKHFSKQFLQNDIEILPIFSALPPD